MLKLGEDFRHNPARPVHRLKDDVLNLPRRDTRVLTGYTFLGRKVDVTEASRGCTFDCSFCSIIEMRGRNFHTYPIDRVLADLRDARAGARGTSSSWTTILRYTCNASKRSARPY